MSKQCAGITKRGDRCPNVAIRGDFCFAHAPDLEAARSKGRKDGGYGKRTERRMLKRLPQDLRDTMDALYRVLGAVESGEMEPSRASAIAQVSRAIVVVYEAGLVEARIRELEGKIAERVA